MLNMIQDFGKLTETWIDKMQEKFNKDLKQLKSKQTEMNNKITDKKYTTRNQ